LDYQRLYEYRFRDVDQERREAVWQVIAPWIHRRLGSPERVLDPAAGRCEFINAVPASERWAVDAVAYAEQVVAPGTRVIVSDVMDVDLPPGHFGAVWVSNFLEHLPTQEHVARFLEKMRACIRPGGAIAVMGPNFRHCADEYFDFADHTLPLTHLAIAEHLYTAGFEVTEIVPRFLPYSFRSRFPSSPSLTRLYLRTPAAWRLLGKQFLVIGRYGGSGPVSEAPSAGPARSD
jgi:SAM-dependent methyltransferase